MITAVLHLAFEGLGAEYATSDAFADNPARRYADDGIERHLVRGVPVVSRRLRLDRAAWAAARTVPVTIEGLAPCRPRFGPAAGPTRGTSPRQQSAPVPIRAGADLLAVLDDLSHRARGSQPHTPGRMSDMNIAPRAGL
ncbi:hypothetical protein [Krasilnikovia sp. MM14-A1259]|uniref:hypothetical protein n=1 Tax=Krasilnikovia sp. MM14-A1259 TaxID=3373539 RepID=UPI003802D878